MKRLKITRTKRQSGFTLMESVYAIMIIGLGVVALMQVFTAGTTVNDYGDGLSKAVFLANELRSMTDYVNYENLMLLDTGPFNGVDANGNAVAGLQNFQQQLIIQPVNPDDLTIYAGSNPYGLLITAAVSRNGQQLTRISWLRTIDKL
jgi:prepilin-type N-terminal cleavage/methylation domain-containing protein